MMSSKRGRRAAKTVGMSGYPYLSYVEMGQYWMEKSESGVTTTAMFVRKEDTALLYI